MAKLRIPLAFMLVMVMVSVLLACAAPAATTTQPATPQDKQVTKVLKFGTLAPMAFLHGKAAKLGADLAIKKINDAGGMKVGNTKYIFEHVVIDTNEFLSVPDAVSATTRMCTIEKADFIQWGYRSETALAQQEVLADNKKIHLAGSFASEEPIKRIVGNYERYKGYFRFWSPRGGYVTQYYMSILPPVIDVVKKELGVAKPKVALVMAKELFIDPMVPYAENMIPKFGCDVVGVWRPAYHADDVSTELSAIKDAGAHIIYTVNNGNTGSTLAKQWTQLQIPCAMTGGNGNASAKDFWNTSGGNAKYVGNFSYLCRNLDTGPGSKELWDGSLQGYGDTPNSCTIAGYCNPWVLKEAIERAQSVEYDAVIKALEKTDWQSPIGRMKLDSDPKYPHEVLFGPEYTINTGIQWTDANPDNWTVYWPNGKEVPQALIDAGYPSGWDKIKFPGIVDYQLPPWVKTYWQGKK